MSTLKRLAEWSPTQWDGSPAGFTALRDRAEWLVAPVVRTRDPGGAAGVLMASNWYVQSNSFLSGESADYETHRVKHWARGWYEILIVRPGSAAAEKAAELAERLECYPILDEDDYSERERAEADEIWQMLYSPAERVEYIREHRNQFEFDSFTDLLKCVRGHYFGGYASEIVQG